MRTESKWGARLVRWGLWALSLGVVPMLAVLGAQRLGLVEDPNPVGLGLLFMLTFWPGVAMLVAGLMVKVVDWLG
jgi:hypothetical protein